MPAVFDRPQEIRCRACGCTEMRPCDPPCAWAEGEGNLCTTCASFRDNELADYWEKTGARVSGLMRLFRELLLELHKVPARAKKTRKAKA